MGTLSFLSKLKNRQRGFMLVDALTGLVILSIGLVGVMQIYIYGTQYRAEASMHQKAIQIAAEGIEKLKNDEAAGANLSAMTTTAADISKEIQLTDLEKFTTLVSVEQLSDGTTFKGDENVVLVTSNVQWTNGKTTQDVSLHSYVTLTD